MVSKAWGQQQVLEAVVSSGDGGRHWIMVASKLWRQRPSSSGGGSKFSGGGSRLWKVV